MKKLAGLPHFRPGRMKLWHRRKLLVCPLPLQLAEAGMYCQSRIHCFPLLCVECLGIV